MVTDGKTVPTEDTGLFPLGEWQKQLSFYQTRPEYSKLLDYRKEAARFQGVGNIFCGDSLTNWWPLQEFFPGVSILNRGITGDTALGLHYRVREDVLAYAPKRVFVLIGINDIEESQELVLARIKSVVRQIAESGADVFASSILPLRDPDSMAGTDEGWEKMGFPANMQGREQVMEMMRETCRRRIRCGDRILWINQELCEWAGENGIGYIDYHSALADASGQLAEAYAFPDGNHITFEAYKKMSEVVEPFLLRQ